MLFLKKPEDDTYKILASLGEKMPFQMFLEWLKQCEDHCHDKILDIVGTNNNLRDAYCGAEMVLRDIKKTVEDAPRQVRNKISKQTMEDRNQ